MRQQGFTLIESTISLALFLIVLLGALQIYSDSQKHFLSLKESQEICTNAWAALDKINTDIQRSGQKLAIPASLGLLEPISMMDGVLCSLSAAEHFSLQHSLPAGQVVIPLIDTNGIKQGDEICIFDSRKGETATVISIEEDAVSISASLMNSYGPGRTSIVLLKRITFYLEEKKKILRRKVNSSPAQPLCDHVGAFTSAYDPSTNLVKIMIQLNTEPVKKHETYIFPKNAALAIHR